MVAIEPPPPGWDSYVMKIRYRKWICIDLAWKMSHLFKFFVLHTLDWNFQAFLKISWNNFFIEDSFAIFKTEVLEMEMPFTSLKAAPNIQVKE